MNMASVVPTTPPSNPCPLDDCTSAVVEAEPELFPSSVCSIRTELAVDAVSISRLATGAFVSVHAVLVHEDVPGSNDVMNSSCPPVEVIAATFPESVGATWVLTFHCLKD